MTANYQLSKVALSTDMSRDNFVPYLALNSETSEAVDAGLDDSSRYTDNQNLVPSKDVRGRTKAGTRDIGAYEYSGGDGLISLQEKGEDFFVITQDDRAVTVVSMSGRALNLNIVDMTGRTVYSDKGADRLTVAKKELNAGIAVFVLSDGVSKKAQKVVIY